MDFQVIRLSTILLFIVLAIPPDTFGQVPKEARQLRTVVIDPGHGGHDPGAVVGDVREKDIVLSVALRLGNKIKNEFPDVAVIYTRSKDVFIPLFERASKAIRNKADIFISIHANYVSTSSVRGTETFTLGLHRSQENLEVAKKENSVILLEDNYSSNYQGFNPKETESYIMFENMQSEYQAQSIALASNIQDEFTRNIGLANRGVKQAGFLVLRQTSMPSVLVEVGFISNASERKFLVSESGKEKISESIFQAFSDYKKMIDQKSRFDITSEDQTTTSNGVSVSASFPASIPSRNSSDSLINQPSAIVSQVSKTEITTDDSSKNALTDVKNKQKVTAVSIPAVQVIPTKPENNEVYYSVQLSAIRVALEPTPGNFKGEKNIFRVKVEPYFKFFSGKFRTPDEAFKEKTRLQTKYQDAFVVVFENDIPSIYKKR
jgi:N-acetylmuramoyl-L-alanine amidase